MSEKTPTVSWVEACAAYVNRQLDEAWKWYLRSLDGDPGPFPDDFFQDRVPEPEEDDLEGE